MRRAILSLMVMLVSGCASTTCVQMWEKHLLNTRGDKSFSCEGKPDWGKCPTAEEIMAMLTIGAICTDGSRKGAISGASEIGFRHIWGNGPYGTDEDLFNYIWFIGGLYQAVDMSLARPTMTDPVLTGEPFPFVDDPDICFEELGCKESNDE